MKDRLPRSHHDRSGDRRAFHGTPATDTNTKTPCVCRMRPNHMGCCALCLPTSSSLLRCRLLGTVETGGRATRGSRESLHQPDSRNAWCASKEGLGTKNKEQRYSKSRKAKRGDEVTQRPAGWKVRGRRCRSQSPEPRPRSGTPPQRARPSGAGAATGRCGRALGAALHREGRTRLAAPCLSPPVSCSCLPLAKPGLEPEAK